MNESENRSYSAMSYSRASNPALAKDVSMGYIKVAAVETYTWSRGINV